MGLGTKGSGAVIGLRARVETSNIISGEKGERWAIETTDAVLLKRGSSENEVTEQPLANGRAINYFVGSQLFVDARDKFYSLMGVPAGTEPDPSFIVGTTYEFTARTRAGSDFTDFVPRKVVEVSEQAAAAEPLSFKDVAALLNGKTPKESMALRDAPGIKGTSMASFIGVKTRVLDPTGPLAGLVEYDETTGTYKAV